MKSKLERIKELTEELDALDFDLESFFDLSLDLFAVAHADGYFRRLNGGWEEILGWTINELLSKPWIEFVHPDDVEETKKVAASMMFDDLSFFSNRYRKKDGNYITLSWRATRWNNDGLAFCVARTCPCWTCAIGIRGEC